MKLLGGAGEQTGNLQLYETVAQEEHKYAEGFDGQREQGSQTETVFGLRDLPTVKEIVNKKMQEKRKLEEVDVAGRTGTYCKVPKFSDA